MLVHSNKPQTLRLHEIEQRERSKFISSFTLALTELLPHSTNRTIKSSMLLTKILAAFPDLYYTLVNVYLSKRRLGEQYTYIAMYKQKHYMQEGVLLNKKTRLLLFILQMISRNLLSPLFSKFMNPAGAFEQSDPQGSKKSKARVWEGLKQLGQRVKEGVGRYLGSAQEIMSNVEWLILMVYMLDWNKHFTFIETLLGIRYVYTYKNDQIREVSYAIEGYLLLATFLFKAGKNLYASFRERQVRSKEPQPPPSQIKPGSTGKVKKEKNLCRICYDDIQCRSSTKCGHIFCWTCIVKTLEMTEECPVCRTSCLPREVVQLRNI